MHAMHMAGEMHIQFCQICRHAFGHAKWMHVGLYKCDLQVASLNMIHDCAVACPNMICDCAVMHSKVIHGSMVTHSVRIHLKSSSTCMSMAVWVFVFQ